MAEIRINATGGVKLYDADDSHYAQIIAGTITSNVDALTLGHASADFNIPVKVLGTTPTLTIGDAGAEDTKIVFDGNAQDFYIALDDSADDLLIGKGSTVGTTPAIAIDENLKVNIPVTTASTSASTGSLTTGGGAGIGADLYVGDDTYLITDSAVLGFGADKDTTLTHTDGTGLTLNSTNKLCFNDASQFVQGISATVLGLGATDEIDLTATAVDLNGTLDVSGNSQFSGTITVGVDGTGKDVKLFGATSGKYWLWDESADGVVAVSNLQQTGTVTVGVDDTGHDVKFFGATSGKYMEWDESADILNISGKVGLSTFGPVGVGAECKVYNGSTYGKTLFVISEDNNHGSDGVSGYNAILGVEADIGDGQGGIDIKNLNIHHSGGDHTMMVFFNNADGVAGKISHTAATTVAYTTSSDYRLKENEVEITDGITKVKQLKPYKFNWKVQPDDSKVSGFFAHEVQTVVPEAIVGIKDAMRLNPDGTNYTNDDGEEEIAPQGIDEGKLVPLLTAALKELIARVEILEG